MTARGADVRVPRDLEPYKEAALAAGWELAQTRDGHVKWVPPAGSIVITPGRHGKRGGGRSEANSKATLERYGLRLERDRSGRKVRS